MEKFNDLHSFFERLKNVDYVVLRNFEQFNSNEWMLDAHPDIDILCANREDVKCLIGFSPKGSREDGIHYSVCIADKKVDIDLRTVGDGYYDRQWEYSIIKNRVGQNNFYIPSPQDYFYSLLYHAYIQKPVVSQDYVNRLCELSAKASVDFHPEKAVASLDAYIASRGYKYTYPEYIGAYVNFSGVDKNLVEKNSKKAVQRQVVRMRNHIRSFAKRVIGG